MTDRHYTKSKKTTQNKPTNEFPELVEMAVDFAILAQKYTVPEIASRLGVSKQAIQYHINRRKGGSK